MIRIFLLLALLILVYGFLYWLQKMPVAMIKAKLIKAGWLLVGLVILLLVATGKLNWLFAMIGVAIAFVLRLLPAILHYAPQLQRLWFFFDARTKNAGQQHGDNTQRRSTGLSKAEALQILGLKAGASDEDIVQAHRKLIAKLHPDKGGSDYLAAKINLAKQVLLQN